MKSNVTRSPALTIGQEHCSPLDRQDSANLKTSGLKWRNRGQLAVGELLRDDTSEPPGLGDQLKFA